MERKKPYTPKEFFEAVMKEIDVPDIIEHCSAGKTNPWLRNYEFEVFTDITYGSCEDVYLDVNLRGNYLDVNLRGNYDGEPGSMLNIITIGTIKTLSTDEDSIKKLYALAAEIFIKANDFIRDNIDDFTWLGYRLKIKPEDKCGFEMRNLDRVADKLLELKSRDVDISNITVFDYATRREVSQKDILKLVERKEKAYGSN